MSFSKRLQSSDSPGSTRMGKAGVWTGRSRDGGGKGKGGEEEEKAVAHNQCR